MGVAQDSYRAGGKPKRVTIRETAEHDSFQFIPPEFARPSYVAGGHEERSGSFGVHQRARGLMQVVGIAVIEGDGDGESAVHHAPAGRFDLVEANTAKGTQYVEVFREVLGRDAQRPGIECR